MKVKPTDVLLKSLDCPGDYLLIRTSKKRRQSLHLAFLINLGFSSQKARANFDTEAVRAFVHELEILYTRLEGKAELVSWDYDDCISFRVVDKGRGRIAVGGTFSYLDYNACFEGGLTKQKGIEIRFDGLVIEQSFIPGILDKMKVVWEI